MAYCHSHVDNLVVVVAPAKRLGIDVVSQGRLVVTWGAWPSPKDCSISANLGGHVIFLFKIIWRCGYPLKNGLPAGGSGVEVAGAIVVVGMMRSLGCPRRGVV